MGLDAILRSENRDDLAAVPDSEMLFSRAAATGAFSNTRLLRYLLPGDTVFTQAQAEDLRDDIRSLTCANADTPLSRHLVAIGELVERLSSQAHSYLWFMTR